MVINRTDDSNNLVVSIGPKGTAFTMSTSECKRGFIMAIEWLSGRVELPDIYLASNKYEIARLLEEDRHSNALLDFS